MANRKSAAGRKNADDNWRGFINHNLGSSDKIRIKDLLAKGEHGLYRISELLESGYTFKIKWDDYGSCPAILCFGGEDAGGDAGWAISARHPELDVAILALVEKDRQLRAEDGFWLKPPDDGAKFDW